MCIFTSRFRSPAASDFQSIFAAAWPCDGVQPNGGMGVVLRRVQQGLHRRLRREKTERLCRKNACRRLAAFQCFDEHRDGFVPVLHKLLQGDHAGFPAPVVGRPHVPAANPLRPPKRFVPRLSKLGEDRLRLRGRIGGDNRSADAHRQKQCENK